MVSVTIESELHKHMEKLSAREQQQALDHARNLATSMTCGVPGAALLSLAGTAGAKDLALMAKAIESGCETVDAKGWQSW